MIVKENFRAKTKKVIGPKLMVEKHQGNFLVSHNYGPKPKKKGHLSGRHCTQMEPGHARALYGTYSRYPFS